MPRSPCAILAASLVAAALARGQAQPPPGYPELAILHLKVIEGEGAVHVAGSRSATPLTVQVTDEVGRPVEGATVSFRLPVSGPSGVFASGLPTEVLVTGPDGRAGVSGIRWGSEAGPVRIRITAVRGQARAGVISEQFLVEPTAVARPAPGPRRPSVSRGQGRWLTVALVAAGAAAGGLALGLAGKSQGAASLPGATTAQNPGVQIGAPTIQVGKP